MAQPTKTDIRRDSLSKFIFGVSRAILFTAPLAIAAMVGGPAIAIGAAVGLGVSFLVGYGEHMSTTGDQRSAFKQFVSAIVPPIIGGALGGAAGVVLAGGLAAGGAAIGSAALLGVVAAGAAAVLTTAAHVGLNYVADKVGPKTYVSDNENKNGNKMISLGTWLAVACVAVGGYTFKDNVRELPAIRTLFEAASKKPPGSVAMLPQPGAPLVVVAANPKAAA